MKKTTSHNTNFLLCKIQFDLSYHIFVEICNFKIIPETE